jgi:hypothetical protein
VPELLKEWMTSRVSTNWARAGDVRLDAVAMIVESRSALRVRNCNPMIGFI